MFNHSQLRIEARVLFQCFLCFSANTGEKRNILISSGIRQGRLKHTFSDKYLYLYKICNTTILVQVSN